MQVSLMLQALHDRSLKERKLTRKQLKLGGFISFETKGYRQNAYVHNAQRHLRKCKEQN